MEDDIAIGIDLGTTNSCVAIYRNKKVEIIPNDNGNMITPSYVAFDEKKGKIIGDDAKSQAVFNPENTIFDVKRLIGRKFDDPEIQADIKNWPFKVVNENSKPKVEVDFRGSKKSYFPEEISSMILGKLKDVAEKYLEAKVTSCVITVPAYFNDSQRVATIDAGKIAGMRVLRIINEPTSAAIAYGLNKNSTNEEKVLIYDLGGGTFDVSILKINGININVLSTGGNTHLGGEDFDNAILDFAIEEFKKIHNGVDIRGNKKSLRRLRNACEKAKRDLSEATTTDINVDLLIDNLDLLIPFTREQFEKMNDVLFKSTLHVVTDCLKRARLDNTQIDQIVLVGGSTRIPKIKSIVQEFFNNKNLNQSINPDEAVAYGAAVQAFIRNKNKTKEIDEIDPIKISDVTPLSLGIELRSGEMSILIPRNTGIPVAHSKLHYPSSPFQTSAKIIIYEGEQTIAKKNHLLGEFTISGFKPSLFNDTELDVTFSIDENSILTVTCVERSSNIQNSININHDKGRLTKEQIDRIINECKQFKNEDQKREETLMQKNKIIQYCNDVINRLTTKKKSFNSMYEDPNQETIDECRKTIKWIDDNPNAEQEELENIFKEIVDFCKQFI